MIPPPTPKHTQTHTDTHVHLDTTHYPPLKLFSPVMQLYLQSDAA